MNKQPDNEAIIAKVADAEAYIKNLIIELIKLGATPGTISAVCNGLGAISNSYHDGDYGYNLLSARLSPPPSIATDPAITPINVEEMINEKLVKIFDTVKTNVAKNSFETSLSPIATENIVISIEPDGTQNLVELTTHKKTKLPQEAARANSEPFYQSVEDSEGSDW